MYAKSHNKRANVIRGKKAKVYGDQFENLIRFHANKIGAASEKIPSGCKWVSGVRAIPVKTPFDYIVSWNKHTIIFDAKSTSGKTFIKSQVEAHQVQAMSAFERAGLNAGYLVWLREIDSIVFFLASQLIELKRGSSLKLEDGIHIGRASDMDLRLLLNGKKEYAPKTTI